MNEKLRLKVLATAVAFRVKAKLLNERADGLLASLDLTPHGRPKKFRKPKKKVG